MKAAILLLALLSCAWSKPNRTKAGCGDGKVRGVNLGGWLVLEPWITPKFFEEVNGDGDQIVDEYTYAQYLDPDVYKERMVGHWDTFYTQEDFQKMADAGLSHIRIPIAYWYWDVIDGEPFPPPLPEDDPQGALFYLKRALGWMDELGLMAILDLHTGPESQNGYDNSGRRGDIHWVDGDYPADRANLDRTVEIVGMISETAKRWIDEGSIQDSTIYGIGILNEPHVCGWHFDGALWPACIDDFYPKAHDKVREYFDEKKVVIDIAAHGYGDFNGAIGGAPNIDLDAHNYQCFGGYWNDVALSGDGWGTHIDASCGIAGEISGSPLNTFVGEFSLSVTECTKYLSGGYMIDYIPPDNDPSLCDFYNNDFSTYQDDYKEFLGNFFLAQIDSFEAGAGWIFWTGKTEDNCAPEWDYLFLVENGILPADICSRNHVCY